MFAMKAKVLAFPSFLLAIGALAACVWLTWASVENLRSSSWPRTEGTIESMRVLEKVGTRGGVQYTIEISYRFLVAGQVYHGDRFNTRGNYLAGEAGASEVSRNYRP